MKTEEVTELKRFEWQLMYKTGKAVFLIYCPQVKQVWAFIKRPGMSMAKNDPYLQDLLEVTAESYHSGKITGDKPQAWMNYLLTAKIKCTYERES